MRTTVTEALRIQTEIGNLVSDAMLKSRYLQYGTILQDGTPIEERGQKTTIEEYLVRTEKLFALSQSAHSVLAKFAVESGVSDKVRERENLKHMRDTLERAINDMPTGSVNRFEVVGNQRVKIVSDFVPFISKKELKERVKAVKAQIRQLQAEIDALNAQVIELPFEYEDLEEENKD